MNSTIVKMPHKFEKGQNRQVSEAISTGKDATLLVLDFQDLCFSHPLSMLKVATFIRQVAKYRRERGLRTEAINIDYSRNCHGYLNYVGFFDFIGLEGVTNPVGAAPGSSSYIPITEISKAELENLMKIQNLSLHDVIFEKADQITNNIVGYEDLYIKKVLRYSFKEILRNVFEHSGAEKCYIAAQHYRTGIVQFGILDEGIGIIGTLSRKYRIETAEAALKYSITPGVTSVDLEDPFENKNNNSGYGLFILSEISKLYGWFEIGSSGGSLLVNAKGQSYSNYPDFQGTFIGINFHERDFNFDEKINEIVENGELEARLHGYNTKASSSSKKF
ncbi:MAG: hypothetical protein OCD01_19035 [Fibrobacterales bacterium]